MNPVFRSRLASVTIVFALVLALPARGELAPGRVPEPLRPWVDWVLHDQREARCPVLHGGSERQCFWPSALELDLGATGGTATQEWLLFRDGWVPLPGSVESWPQDVMSDGEPVVVREEEGRPQIRLSAGRHRIEVSYRWTSPPESLAVPTEVGLLRLRLNGQPVAFPNRGDDGQLWLQQRTSEAAEESRLDLDVYRRVVDEVPLQLDTRLVLRVAGKGREELLGQVLPEGFIPLSLTSPLPARLEPDGRLRVQLRPGIWEITLVARHHGSIDALSLPPAGDERREEIWAFDARSALRVVEVEGVTAVNPEQTELPSEWSGLPAYRVRPGETFRLQERQRGDAGRGEDSLVLRRVWWLDFDGGGYTLHDDVTGSVRRSTRLDMQASVELGRVAIDSKDQFLTHIPGQDAAGVELRSAELNLAADSRLNSALRELPAAGWDHDFEQTSAELRLPPGWRLLHASGVDSAEPTWITRWNLLDLFVVLITTMAISRLWGWPLGAIALAALTLTHTEPEAPTAVWLFLVAVEAIVRIAPEGRWQSSARFVRLLVVACLLLVSLPYIVGEVRQGMHPAVGTSDWPAAPAEAPEPFAQSARYLGSEVQFKKSVYDEAEAAPVIDRRTDPNAVVQTGPGLPTWTWHQVSLGWNGPVERGETFRLYLLSPRINLLLAVLRSLLLFVLIGGITVAITGYRGLPGRSLLKTAAVLLLIAVGATRAQAEFPSPELLGELKQRLLEPPDCEPVCAGSSQLQLEANEKELRLVFYAEAAARTAVPLPGGDTQWLPQTILVDGVEVTAPRGAREADSAVGLRRSEGVFWLTLTPGRHTVVLQGPLPDRDAVQLSMRLKPHRVEVATLQGWRIDGVGEDGVADDDLQLTRVRTDGNATASLEAGTLPPFVVVTRSLHLGLTWTVETTVSRMTPTGVAAILEIPLLPGELITSAQPRVIDGKAQVNLAPAEESLSWQSVLQTAVELTLRAADSSQYAETWKLDVEPMWHVALDGIPSVHRDLPTHEWRPWPGEEVHVTISRPAGIGGQTTTIDDSIVRLSPGQRATDLTLELTLRSSRGGQHTLTLPAGSVLQSLTINEVAQPVRQEEQRVVVPISPGTQKVKLAARLDQPIERSFVTPPIDLGAASVNATTEIQVPSDRWVLLVGGPSFGPAVLFWSLLVVTALIALALGRVTLTPLRTLQWFLLGIGLTQVPVYAAMVIVGWLIALGWRSRYGESLGRYSFNGLQLLLIGWTLIALLALFWSIEQGLLGLPEMQIAGNGSDASVLRWYQDRAGSELPQAWFVSVPLLVYRLAMLAWALWLAQALLSWLRWGWDCFRTGGLWRSLTRVASSVS